MPMSFSALCIMSFVMRSVGGGEGWGIGEGVGVGVCAIIFSGEPDTARPAAPAAGRSLTKDRRLMLLDFSEPTLTVRLLTRVFFIESSTLSYLPARCCRAIL